MRKNEADFTDQEAQRRFERTLRAALHTPPKPLKEMRPKKSPKRSKRHRQRDAVKPSSDAS